jgi:CRP/FNR family transcriptional regulator
MAVRCDSPVDEEMRSMAATPCDACPLRGQPLFKSNTAEEIDFIASMRRGNLKYQAGAQIVSQGDDDSDLYTLFSGWAFRFKELEDARRQILNILMPGDFMGFHISPQTGAPYGIECLTDVEVCVFPRRKLWDLFRNHPGLAYDVTWLTAHEEGIVDDNLLSVGQRSGVERVATIVLAVYKRARQLDLVKDNALDFPLTQSHIADMLGMSLIHTNRVLRRLHRDGVFTLARKKLQVHDTRALRSLAAWAEAPVPKRPLI